MSEGEKVTEGGNGNEREYLREVKEEVMAKAGTREKDRYYEGKRRGRKL